MEQITYSTGKKLLKKKMCHHLRHLHNTFQLLVCVVMKGVIVLIRDNYSVTGEVNELIILCLE